MSQKILIVDDDDIVVFIHSMLIKDSGLTDQPLVFKNGKTAFEFISDQETVEDKFIVFLDLNMPVMDGWQFLQLIEDVKMDISVVIVSSSIDPSDLQKARSYSKVTRFIEKPLSLEACSEIRDRLN